MQFRQSYCKNKTVQFFASRGTERRTDGVHHPPVCTVKSVLDVYNVDVCCVYVAVYNVGTPAPDTCGQTVNSLESGVLLSPTYPGMYPDHIFCFYKIHGLAGQRVKLTFTEIDLYLGGDQYVLAVSLLYICFNFQV